MVTGVISGTAWGRQKSMSPTSPSGRLTLAEEFLLIALDDDKGEVSAWSSDIDPALAGGLVLDLTLAGSLTTRDGKLATAGGAPGGDSLLGEAHAAVAAEDGEHDPKKWVERLPRALKPLKDRVAGALVERGVLSEERSKLLGLISRTRWPESDPEPESALRERLAGVLTGAAEADRHDAMLIALLEPFDLVAGLVSRDERKQAKRRAKEFRENDAVAGGVHDVVQEIATAVLVTTTVVASAAVVSNN